MKKVRKSISVFIIATLIFFMSYSPIARAEINQTVLTENQSMEMVENIHEEGIPWDISNTESEDNIIALTTNDWVSASAEQEVEMQLLMKLGLVLMLILQ